MATVPSRSLAEIPRQTSRLRWWVLRLGGLALVAIALVWSWRATEFSLGGLATGAPAIARFVANMTPPDTTWEILKIGLKSGLLTLQIALLGTGIGALFAVLLGLLAANNLTPEWVHHPLKILLAIMRSIPILLLGLIFVGAVGLGGSPGVLAIAIHTIGNLAKLFADECETAFEGVWEAMDSAGANWSQKVRFAVWPQVAPQIVSLTLYRFEMNIRESAVLGFVGCAGIGYYMEIYRRSFNYPRVCTMVLFTMAIVLGVDQLSVQIRKRIS
ncbi:MAG: phosphonate ABC transporter, permease protein PhnE [Planctomycetes bacterium]|nr:phosphonate ABC transporter, permease protein PhnE [Planctomycetota bacterium]